MYSKSISVNKYVTTRDRFDISLLNTSKIDILSVNVK
jgi:hypothetical protein